MAEEKRPTLAQLKAAYTGKPPIPIEELEREFPPALGFKVRHADYYEQADGRTRCIPTAIVEYPDGSTTQFFPEEPRVLAARRRRRQPEGDGCDRLALSDPAPAARLPLHGSARRF